MTSFFLVWFIMSLAVGFVQPLSSLISFLLAVGISFLSLLHLNFLSKSSIMIMIMVYIGGLMVVLFYIVSLSSERWVSPPSASSFFLCLFLGGGWMMTATVTGGLCNSHSGVMSFALEKSFLYYLFIICFLSSSLLLLSFLMKTESFSLRLPK